MQLIAINYGKLRINLDLKINRLTSVLLTCTCVKGMLLYIQCEL